MTFVSEHVTQNIRSNATMSVFENLGRPRQLAASRTSVNEAARRKRTCAIYGSLPWTLCLRPHIGRTGLIGRWAILRTEAPILTGDYRDSGGKSLAQSH
jgi:hypothetical protein